MSSKMNYIPHISSYEDIRAEMSNDLQYRLASRTAKTSQGGHLMTVLDFIRAHFSLDSQVDNLLVRRNTDGFCETLYSGAIDDERYMKPEVKCATIRKWCLPRRGSSVILIVE